MTEKRTSDSSRAPSDRSGESREHAVLRPDTGPREDPPSRTMNNRPADPNSAAAKTFPPGVDPRDAMDPGRQTPGAPPVENRSGRNS